jgi:hypothetical protein
MPSIEPNPAKTANTQVADSNAQKRREWISALDKIESLIEQTRQYIRDFDRLAETTTTAQELYDKMLGLYPDRVNPGWALWGSARAVKS